MSWFKVDDKAHSHPKTMMAGNAAFGLWARLGSYCSDHLTDGFVPKEVAAAYGTVPEIRALLRVGYVVEVEGGYQLHDFLEYNPTKEQVLAERARNAKRQEEFRKNKKSSNAGSNGERNAGSNGVSADAPDPDPTRTPSGVRSRTTDDDRDGAPRSSSSEFEAALINTARAMSLKSKRAEDPEGYAQGIARTMRSERGDEIASMLAEGMAPVEIAESICGSGALARKASRGPLGPKRELSYLDRSWGAA